MIERAAAQRAVVELLIIVVGVLIAFQVDSWAQRQGDDAREAAQLAALAVDFEENLARLQDDIERQERHVRATGELLNIMAGSSEMPPQDSLGILFGQASLFQRFEPFTGAYDALLASGDIRLLSDPGLRADLAAFYAVAGDGFEDEALSDLLHFELIRVYTQSLAMVGGLSDGFKERLGFTGQVAPPDWTELLSNQEYMSLLTATAAIESLHLGYFRELEVSAEGILARLREGS